MSSKVGGIARAPVWGANPFLQNIRGETISSNIRVFGPTTTEKAISRRKKHGECCENSSQKIRKVRRVSAHYTCTQCTYFTVSTTCRHSFKFRQMRENSISVTCSATTRDNHWTTVLEAVYIHTKKPNLCKQKQIKFTLRLLGRSSKPR